MAYIIQYSSKGIEKRRHKKSGRSLIGVFMVLVAFTARVLWPSATQYVKDVLFAGMSSEKEQAFAEAFQALTDWENATEIFKAFCTEVISNA